MLFVYREEYYLQSREPKKPIEGDDAKVFDDYSKWSEQMRPIDGLSELIIAKQRHGATGKVKLKFESKITRFSDYIEESYLPEARG